jgi:metal-responsive CopG/Arc/MetJ family transcriptional regulator
MKQKTSVSLSSEVLRDLERYAGTGESRSAYIERVLRRHFRRRARARVNARDRARIDAAADRLNAEAAEVLEDQASWRLD